MNGEGKGAYLRTRAIHPHTQLREAINDAGHRSSACVRIAVEIDRPVGQGGKGRDEPHHGAGKAAVDARRTAQGCGGRHDDVAVLTHLDLGAESAQGLDHERRIARMQRSNQMCWLARKCCEQQIAVRERLGARNSDDGVQARGSSGRWPGLLWNRRGVWGR